MLTISDNFPREVFWTCRNAKEQLHVALQVYYEQLHYPQVSLSVKQKQPATLDEAVAATIVMQTYLPPKTAALMTEVKLSLEAD